MPSFEMKESYPKAMDALRALGFVKAVVSFSGGNDSGGADEIILTHQDGLIFALDDDDELTLTDGSQAKNDEAIVVAGRAKILQSIAGGQKIENLSELLCEPVYDKYHTFAGEYSVTGTVEFDVLTGEVAMDDAYQEDTYEDDEDGDDDGDDDKS